MDLTQSTVLGFSNEIVKKCIKLKFSQVSFMFKTNVQFIKKAVFPLNPNQHGIQHCLRSHDSAVIKSLDEH